MHRQTTRDLLVFFLLVVIGVAGRWCQPQWHFTPMSAIAVFAGFYFAPLGVALLVPLAVRTITDWGLPAHDNLGVLVFVYLTTLMPVWLGRLLRNPPRGAAAVARWTACGLAPAAVFYLTTNFAVWALKSDYAKTASGLIECYWMAVPFFRWMLAGDLFYLAVLLGCYLAAGALSPRSTVRSLAKL